jgi:NAD(P)-dependent dehydrogenase (short-subunit alcohol dehydrogenase family)
MSRQKQWDSSNIGTQNGRVAIVTGSSSGIGFEAARVLAERGARVVLAVRNMTKGIAAMGRIRAQHEHADVVVMELDLALLDSVKEFTAAFKRKFDRLDLLINNAGVMIPPYGRTADGFELQMGTNHLGHFALTGQLLDRLLATAGARVVNVSSMAHRYGNIDFEDLHWEKRTYRASRAYGDSKIANLYFTQELQRKLRDAGSDLLVTAAHPGWTATDLQRHSGTFDFLNGFFAQSPAMGALPTLRAALDADARGGEFYGPDGFMQMRGYPVLVQPNDRAREVDTAIALWDVSTRLTGVDFDATLEEVSGEKHAESV